MECEFHREPGQNGGLICHGTDFLVASDGSFENLWIGGFLFGLAGGRSSDQKVYWQDATPDPKTVAFGGGK